jgi:plasmid stabilization system protein ParE
MEKARRGCGGIENRGGHLILGRPKNGPSASEERLKRLANEIDRLADKDEDLMRRERETSEVRRAAATELHAICASFVGELNKLLKRTELRLDPEVLSTDGVELQTPTLIQVQVRGRILQVMFTATPGLSSTEEFRIPYIMEGSVRAFSQDMLDKELIEEQLLFYTLETRGNLWRYFDTRTYRSGPFDREYLTALMEKII